MQLFDLKSFLPIGDNSAALRKEIVYHEYRQNGFFSNHGFRPIVSLLDDLIFEAGAIYILDRGYIDFVLRT